MAGTAYHMEALRRQRVLERKSEAVKRIENTIAQAGEPSNIARELKESQQLVFSEPGQYAQNRYMDKPRQQTTNNRPTPEPASLKNIQRDQVYHIIHPKQAIGRFA